MTTTILLTVSLLILSLILKSLGRPWYKPTQNSGGLYDWYSCSHFLHGFLFMFFSLPVCIFLECLWEVIENTPYVINKYRRKGYKDYAGDSIVNSCMDVVFCVSGWYVATTITLIPTIVVFVLLEVVMYIAIKDNLTLNIIKIIKP